MFFELVSILFTLVPDYGNKYMTKENKNLTSFKNFAPKLYLHHNTAMLQRKVSINYGRRKKKNIASQKN